MPTLHLVFNRRGLNSCLACKSAADSVVLMADAVYASKDHKQFWVLAEDLAKRGISSTQHTLSMQDVVNLTESHHPIVSWAE